VTRARARRAALALPALLAAAACGKQGSAPPVTQVSLADSAEQVMQTVRTLLTDRGVQRGELFADSAYVFDNGTRFELRKVRVTFNTVTGTKDGTMAADRGRYNTSQQVLEGYGHVVVTTTSGKRLTSPHLRYSQLANEVSSDSAFTMVEPGRTLSGIGFRSDPQLTNVTVLKAPKGAGSFTLPGQ
jgi:LPS export ABC transporter protein LptC